MSSCGVVASSSCLSPFTCAHQRLASSAFCLNLLHHVVRSCLLSRQVNAPNERANELLPLVNMSGFNIEKFLHSFECPKGLKLIRRPRVRTSLFCYPFVSMSCNCNDSCEYRRSPASPTMRVINCFLMTGRCDTIILLG